ncbi:Uncharacterised protein [Mycobacteroides abscessus subsp. abscessus]|nr:Uncharacterised protein [Mycobacteroides abscessus subsp. abscessus]
MVDHDRTRHREVENILIKHPDHRESEDPEGDAQQRKSEVVGPNLERERRRGVLGVVVLEVVVDEMLDLLPRPERVLHGRVVEEPPADADGERDRDEQHRQPPPTSAVERSGQRRRDVPHQLVPRGHRRPECVPTSPRQQRRQVGDYRTVWRRRSDHRQVRGRALVGVEDLVGFGAGEVSFA